MSTVFYCLFLVSIVLGEPTIHFKEQFDDGWKTRWVRSTSKEREQGKFGWSAGKFFSDPDKDRGLQTTQDSHFYTISAKFDKPFSNKGKTLVVQYTVKHEQQIDCGGGYVKIFPSDLDQKNLDGESPYLIMFGPDICGSKTKIVHVIFSYKGENHLIKKEIKCKDDVLTHLYTLIVRPDNRYEVKIDNELMQSGRLDGDWDMLPPKKIKDPDAKKPDDWDEREKINDPDDKKPDDWDLFPEFIPDPEAEKPEDWDEGMDGEWEPSVIKNPDYKGNWKPKKIGNPDYKGKWVHPEIDNPEFIPNPFLYSYKDIGAIGFDLWQVKSGTIFDNILVTDNVEYAEEFGKETWGAMTVGEKAMKEKQRQEEALLHLEKVEKEEKKAQEEKDKEAKEKEDHKHKETTHDGSEL